MDEIDQAQAREQEARTAAIAAARVRHGQGTNACIDCDEEISAARKAANPHATRCADCQSDYEAR